MNLADNPKAGCACSGESSSKPRTVIVTTDFSPESVNAFPYAKAQLIQPQDRLILLTVLEDLVVTSVQFEFGLTLIDPIGVIEHAESEANKKIQQMLASQFQGCNAIGMLIRAVKPIHAEIVGFAREEQADIIVLSTHGRTGLSHLIMGSVAENVVRYATCPVLVIPNRAPPK